MTGNGKKKNEINSSQIIKFKYKYFVAFFGKHKRDFLQRMKNLNDVQELLEQNFALLHTDFHRFLKD